MARASGPAGSGRHTVATWCLVAATVAMAAAVMVLDLAVREAMHLGGDDGRVFRAFDITEPATGLVAGASAVLVSGAAMWWAARHSAAPRIVLLTGPALLLLMAWNCFEAGFRAPVDLGPLVGGILLVVAGAAPLTVVRSWVRRRPVQARSGPRQRDADGDTPPHWGMPPTRHPTRLQRSHDAAVVRPPLPARSTRPDRIWMERVVASDGGVPSPRTGQVRQRSR